MIQRFFAVALALAVTLFFTAGCTVSNCLPDPSPSTETRNYHYGAYLWVGPPDVAPPCPPAAPNKLFEAYADLGSVAHTCPACTCGPSATDCSAPAAWNVVAAACGGGGSAPKTAFDAPANWEGVCTTAAKIDPDAMCGGAPCAQSVVVDPPQAIGGACTPMAVGQETKPGPPWPWGTLARGCAEEPSNECKLDNLPSSGAYAYCVRLDKADDECPSDYKERHELFQDVDDQRACAPCTCGAPQGGSCAMKLAAFSDEACGSKVGSAYASSNEGPVCFDVPDGTALRSKSAEQTFSAPGTCAQSGGAPTGQVVPAKPVTWCCPG